MNAEIPYDPDLHDRTDGNRPDSDLEKKDEAQLLFECLGRLEPNCREAIIKYYGMELTTKETAIELEIPEPTVKSHLQRGRKRLRRILISHGVRKGPD